MMLNKRTFSCATALVAVALAANSYGQVVIGDFEGGSDDGWASTDAGIIATSTNFDNAIHATTGDYALNVFALPAGAFRWSVQLNNEDIANLGELLVNNPIVKADVSWTTSEWTGDADGNWARWDSASINSDVGWIQTSDAEMGDSANPGFPGSWDVASYGDSHVRTISWDFSSLIAGSEDAITNSGFFQLNLSTNFDPNFDTGNGYSYWIDNIRLEQVPEPSSIALLSLGAAALLYRRRRSA